jgi:predicted membrane channel-forming protein YqfA (hemolysin III family)
MNINYHPSTVNWLANKREHNIRRFKSLYVLIGAVSIIVLINLLQNLPLPSLWLIPIASVLLFIGLVGVFFYVTKGIYTKPHLEVEFLQTGEMRYWIVDYSKKELEINHKPARNLSPQEVEQVKRRLEEIWCVTEIQAYKEAYEQGYKSQSKKL